MVEIKKETIKKFWEYVNQTCNQNSIEQAIEENEFDIGELEDSNLDKLDQNGLNNLMQYLVYIVVNGPGGGDYETMYYILSENFEFDRETIAFLMEV